jgi:hypothetical protein
MLTLVSILKGAEGFWFSKADMPGFQKDKEEVD